MQDYQSNNLNNYSRPEVPTFDEIRTKNSNPALKWFTQGLLIAAIGGSAFFGGMYMGKRGYVYEIRRNPPVIKIVNEIPDSQTVDFDRFWTVWNIVQNEYLERPVDGEKMLEGAISGMVHALEDPYTSYFTPVQNDSVQSSLNGTYEGIGAELTEDENGTISVVSPLDGSPAAAAGLRPGDIIMKIDDESAFGMTLTDAVTRIRGDANTEVVLTVVREGVSEAIPVTIRRGKITIDSVMWEDKGDGIAYIRISRFGEETNSNWDKVAKEVNVNMTELDAIILDVRRNPGGYLNSAVYIAGEFFPKGVVVYEESALGESISFEGGRETGLFQKLPVFILIDEGSASASEILAGALRHHVDATLIGTQSFGKGTIQDSRQFDDGSGLHLTIAKWLTPDKTWVHKVGLTPDIEVKIPEDATGPEDDTQLQKAIELAKEI